MIPGQNSRDAEECTPIKSQNYRWSRCCLLDQTRLLNSISSVCRSLAKRLRKRKEKKNKRRGGGPEKQTRSCCLFLTLSQPRWSHRVMKKKQNRGRLGGGEEGEFKSFSRTEQVNGRSRVDGYATEGPWSALWGRA